MHNHTVANRPCPLPILLIATLLPATISVHAQRKTALDEYVNAPDKAYAWNLASTQETEAGFVHVLRLTSQSWRSPDEVDITVWKHWIRLYRPKTVISDKALLFISGGSHRSEPPRDGNDKLARIAVATGSIVAELGQTPNQPLTFADSPNEKRVEDNLVAYTWDKCLRTGDPTWLARFPMVKGAVRSMDAIQEFVKSDTGGSAKLDAFVVAGGSKRGWTTWMTAAVDPRVCAIVPIVIDVVNVLPSMQHHFSAYGFWAPSVDDYIHHKIMNRDHTPEYKELLKLVDPFYYLDRLTMPKLILNASGDQFFLPDSSQFYFDNLLGRNLLRYVPNADHSLSGTDAYESLLAFYGSILTDEPLPQFSWTMNKELGSIAVKTETKPATVKLWHATNPEARDFRLETLGPVWKPKILTVDDDGLYRASVATPENGWSAFYVELTFRNGSDIPFKVTTEVGVVPDVLPHEELHRERRARNRGRVVDQKE